MKTIGLPPDALKIFYSGLPKGLFPQDRRTGVKDDDGHYAIGRDGNGSPIRSDGSSNPCLFKVKGDRSIHLPLVVDTEFTTSGDGGLQQTPRSHISSQLRHIEEATGVLFFHPDVIERCNQARTRKDMKTCPKLEHEFDAFDWLASKRFSIKCWEGQGKEYRNYPTLVVTLFSHFGVAELNLIFRGGLKTKIKQLQRQGKITQQRRLLAVGETPYQDWVETGYLVKFGHENEAYWKYCSTPYKLAIRFVDTCAIHGVAGYADIAKNVGHQLSHKDNFTKEEKSRMLEMAIERPLDFEEYALGDLDVYEILKKYDTLMREIYKQLEIKDYYREPQLTIGGTVKQLFEAKLAKKLGISGKDWYETFKLISDEFFKPVSPQILSTFTHETKALLGKTQGGRCRNAKQSVDRIEELICDIDISGCYGEGQRNQTYPIGTPLIWSFKTTSKNNHYPSLGEWLKWNGVKFTERNGVQDWGELINGAWMVRVSTFEPLNYPQDLIESWTTPNRDYSQNLLAKFVASSGSDTELQGSDSTSFDVEYGCLKMLHHEILNGVITHDILQIVFTAPPKQRRDFLKKVKVTASMVYPKSQKIEVGDTQTNFELLKKYRSEWDKKNFIVQKYDKKGHPYLIHREQECYGWIDINLGDLLIDELLINRKKAKITDGKKSPKDQLFKLCVNTTYGDLVSKYFVTSNPCVGNNITARARALAWCMERGFDSFQSITDGGCFQLNKVNHKPSFNPRGKKLIAPLAGNGLFSSTYEKTKIKVKNKTTGVVEIKDTWLLKITKDDNLIVSSEVVPDPNNPGVENVVTKTSWIDRKAWEHLSQCFPTLDLFKTETTRIVVDKDLNVTYEPRQGMFEFEVKDFYESGIFHGSANYRLVNPNGVTLRARGYESSRKHDGWVWEDNCLVLSERYGKSTPIGDLLEAIAIDPTRVPRQEVAVKAGILKLKDYTKHCGKYDEMGLEPGDNLLNPLLVSEFSISQFTFKTWEQWNSWEKAIGRAKNKGKQSIEGFFLNRDGTLNYQQMIRWAYQAIEDGVINPYEELDRSRHRNRDDKLIHPQKQALDGVREKLEAPFVRSEENCENTELWKTASKNPELYWGERSRKKMRKISLEPQNPSLPLPSIDYSKMKRKKYADTPIPANLEDRQLEFDYSRAKKKRYATT